MRVSVVMPALNEARSIGYVLAELPRDSVCEIVVVDGGSNDGTAAIATGMGARVIVEPRRGYGRACITGLSRVDSPDVVVFLDADYSDRPAELSRLLEPIRDGRADLVIGSRLSGGAVPGAMPWHSRFGNRLTAALIYRTCGVALTDLGPFRAARYDLLRSLDLREMTYGWPVEMVVRGALRGWRIAEVPVSYHPRIGTSKITGTLKGSVGAGWSLITGIFKYRWLEARELRRARGRQSVR